MVVDVVVGRCVVDVVGRGVVVVVVVVVVVGRSVVLVVVVVVVVVVLVVVEDEVVSGVVAINFCVCGAISSSELLAGNMSSRAVVSVRNISISI